MRRTGSRTGGIACLVAIAAVAAADVTPRPPRGRATLQQWLVTGAYRAAYVPEPAPHASVGPHGLVRTWYAPGLVADLRTGRTTWRAGAAMVKELLDDRAVRVVGFSFMEKVRASSGRRGRGWRFYETADGRSVIAYGRGVGLCVGCHAQGTDFLLSPFRPDP